ncbi:hypothetical protein ACLB2K_026255 [Fragaria x ananassa]
MTFSGWITDSDGIKDGCKFLIRRLSSSGKILSKEERVAENVYIKKTEQEKLARKGLKLEDKATAGPGESITDAKPSGSSSGSGASTAKVSTDKYMNYAVVAGVVTAFAALGCRAWGPAFLNFFTWSLASTFISFLFPPLHHSQCKQ